MFRNYLLVTFRNLLKNRVFTTINIIGLGIALAVCIVAFFNHMFNYEFDRTHENFDKIYRVTSFRDMQGREQEYGVVPATLGLEIKKDIPGIEKSARLIRTGSPVKEGEDIFPAQISYVDPEFLDIFTFPILLGDQKSIESQGNVLISRKMATTLFGDEYPVGKTISIVFDSNKEFTYRIGAVFVDLPENSSFRIDILSHFDNFLLMRDSNDADWKIWASAFFILVPNKSLLPSIAQSLKSYLPVQNRAREDFRINRFTLVPLKDVGSNSRNIWSSGLSPSLHPAAVVAPPIMALFILLIACFNFANTSRATFSKRLKEIGLRKTFGGQRKQLVTQFMFETLIICFMALVAGVAFAEFLVPAYFTSYRNEIITNPRILLAEGTQNHIGFGSYRRPVKDEVKQLEVDVMDIGPGYAGTIGLRLVEGRMFDELRAGADRSNGSIIVNQKLVNNFGWNGAVGRWVTLYDTTRLTVIGVVADFYTSGLWEEIEPAMLRLSPSDKYGVLAVRAKSEDLPDILEYLNQKWKSHLSNYIFGGRLQEDTMQEEKDINGSIMKVNIFLAIVATLLSLIGMYNLVSLDIIRRTKEMGIRKIQGAPVLLLMFLVSKKFLIVLIVASVLGCAGGYYMSFMLLDSIWDYFVDIRAGILLLAALIMFVATIFTIIFKITRAALKNPVVSLRYE